MKRLAAALILGAIVPCAGISQAPQAPKTPGAILDEIAAKVNNDIILKSDVEKAEKELRMSLQQDGLQGTQLEQIFNEQKDNILRNLIDESLLLQIAKEQALTAELEIAKTMEQLRQERNIPTTEALEAEIIKSGMTVEEFKDGIRKKSLSNQVIQHEVTSRIQMTNEEVRAFYDAHQKEFDRPAGIRLQEITVFTDKRSAEEAAAQRKKLEDALAAVKKGDDFAEVARKYSEDEKSAEGGEFGFFEKGKLTKELEDVLSKLNKGETTDIIKVADGLMIFRIEDKHAGGILSFDLAQDEIKNLIFQQRAPPKIREYLTKLRGMGFVKVSEGYTDSGAVPKSEKVSEAK
jgi:peptidyl-prolyl cis-trans isomerase SurA